MGLFNTLKTLVGANVTKANNALEDANMEDILNENHKNETENLRKAKLQVADFGAELKAQTAKRDSAQKRFDQAEAAAKAYLEKGDEANAVKLLESLEGELSMELNGLNQLVAQIDKQYKDAQRIVKQKEQKLNQMKATSEHVKTQHRLNKMKEGMATHSLNTKDESQRAQATLERFQERVNRESTRIDTTEELYGEGNPDSVDNLIAGAGAAETAGLSAAERLAKLRNK
jgi:phage shock protein A